MSSLGGYFSHWRQLANAVRSQKHAGGSVGLSPLSNDQNNIIKGGNFNRRIERQGVAADRDSQFV